MKHYTKKEWAREQYTGCWEASPFILGRVEAGEVPAGYIGRRTVMVGGEYGCTLLTEGIHFLVEDDYDHLPQLTKENAMVGACYFAPGGYIEVTRVYRLTEEEAREFELWYLDRADYIQHAKWGTVKGGCALDGSDVSEYYKEA